MVTQFTRRLSLGLALVPAVAALSLAAACDKVPLLAPTGTVITLFATSSTVPADGEIEIVATVIENGVATTPPSTGTGGGTTPTTTSSAGAGTPVQNGTLVSFTTTIGRIEPAEARTSNGQVRVRFIAGGQSGTATITAFSGGASGKLENLLVGSAAAKRVTVTANPQSLPASGGSVEVIARVETEAGAGLAGVPVTFSTTAGALSPTAASTDASGIARATLTTDRQADVTVTAGAQSGKVTVAVNPRLISGFTALPQSTTAGIPVTFTVTAGANSNIQDAVVTFGDGRQQSLGSFSGTATATNVYMAPGTYTATVTARDAAGAPQSQSTNVTVGALPVTLTASPSITVPGLPVTFTVGGTAAAQVARYQWTFDDGRTFPTSGPSTNQSFDTRGQKVVRVDVVGVGGAILGSAETRITVQ